MKSDPLQFSGHLTTREDVAVSRQAFKKTISTDGTESSTLWTDPNGMRMHLKGAIASPPSHLKFASQSPDVRVVNAKGSLRNVQDEPFLLWEGDVEKLLKSLPSGITFDLAVTSPPYNLGKVYEKRRALEEYLAWQERIIDLIVPRIRQNGSICWQVGNFIDNGQIVPLDIELAPIFKKHGLFLRNRIIWHFGHGLHNKRRFSGRYEVVLWYTKSDEYVFNLDAVRVPAKYPGKRHFKGPKVGQLSSNPLGKNPEDVWDIPNVKSNHIEKTDHPCQFPVGLIQRLVLALTNTDGLVFDPFAGVGSAGVAAALHQRRFWGAELDPAYVKAARQRIDDAIAGNARFRPHDKPLYDHTKSKLSLRPDE